MGFALGGSFVWAIQKPAHHQQIQASDTQPQQHAEDQSNSWWGHSDPGVTLATAVLGAVAIVQAALFFIQLHYMRDGLRDAKVAAEAAEKAAQAAIEANRPWIRIRSIQTDRISFFDWGASITTHIELENTGNSPAIGVQIVSKVFPVYSKTGDVPIMRNGILEQAKRLPYDIGVTVFPKDIQSHPFIASILREEMEEGANVQSDGVRFNVLCVAGCVDYQFPSGRGRHQTTFWCYVQGPVAIQDSGIVPIEFRRITANEIAN
jgi:hypothetical protein